MDTSIIIPVGPSHAKIAERAYASAEAQTVPAKIIMIDDKDGMGPAWARNRGIQQAKTPLVGFLDADDKFAPNYIEETIAVLKWPNWYVYTDWIGSDGTVYEAPEEPYSMAGGWHTITALIPTHWIFHIGGFDETLRHGGEDKEFWYRLRAAGCCGIPLHKPLVQYDNLPNSRSDKWRSHPDRVRLNEKIRKTYGGIAMCKSCGGRRRPMAASASKNGRKTIADFQAPAEFDTLIGRETVTMRCDVLVRPKWRGNRTMTGRGTGYTYPRCAMADTLYIDARDARAGRNEWQVLRASPKAPPAPAGVGVLAPQEPKAQKPQSRAARLSANLYGGVDTPKVRPPAPVPPAKTEPDFARILSMGHRALSETNQYPGIERVSMTVDEIEAAIRDGGYSPLAGGENATGPQQNPRELAEFLHWCNERDVSRVLELGTGEGGTARFMAEVLNWRVMTADIKEPKEPLRQEAGVMFVHASTVDLHRMLYGTSFDMVFIDASHEYYDVKRDHLMFQNHAPIIAFHDIAPGRSCCEGVTRYWGELDKRGDIRHASISEDFPVGIGWYEHEPRPTVDLSIVSGTYNRLNLLKRMINSARAIIPRGTSYEFVIIDGGSTDGSLRWLRKQEDVHLIEDGELTGAIDAFTRGAYAACGRYVLLSNDDIAFEKGSIAAALGHLDSRPECGAVAFADDRISQKLDREPVRRVARLGGQDAQGRPLIYAQIGLFRKWLGDYVDWWGANTGMKAARTYAGDNYLSAKIWELGYSVDAVPECQVDDAMPQDELRKVNTKMEMVDLYGRQTPKDSAEYYRQYPRGPQVPSQRLVGLPPLDITNPSITRESRMRILYLPLYSGGWEQRELAYTNKRGLRDALSQIGMVAEVDYRNLDGNGGIKFNLAEYVRVWQPDLLVTQYHGAANLTPEMMAEARSLKPDMVCVNWCGDASKRKTTSAQAVNVLEHFDLTLTKEASIAKVYAERGLPWAYWQQGYEPPAEALPQMPRYDMVFQGNAYTDLRKQIEVMVRGLDLNAGFYGARWAKSDGDTHLNYGAGEALYKNARLAISDTFPGTNGFCSNRVIQTLAAGGALLLLQKSPGLYKWTGLRANTHYIAWETLDDLKQLIDEWTKPEHDKRRREIVKAGQKHVLEHFTFDALIRQLWFEIMPDVWGKS